MLLSDTNTAHRAVRRQHSADEASAVALSSAMRRGREPESSAAGGRSAQRRIHFGRQRSADEASAKRAAPLCGEGGSPSHQRTSPMGCGGEVPTLDILQQL